MSPSAGGGRGEGLPDIWGILGTFGEFLACSPAKVAGVPQVVGDKAAAPQVAADEAVAPPVVFVRATVPPGVADKATAYRSRRWRRNRRKASSTLQGLEAVPKPALVREPTESTPESAPEPAPVREPTESGP